MTFTRDNTDQELLEALRNDDQDAFKELFNRHWRAVHAMAYARVRSKEVTEEIVQDLFISLWNKRSAQSIQNLPAYLYQAVKFKTLNYIESKLVQEKYWSYYRNYIPQEDDSTQCTVEFDDLMEALEEGLETLPEKSKKVFRLHRLEGWSVAQIASSLNLSEKAIEYHLSQSVKKMRVHLKNYAPAIAVLFELFN